MRKNTTYWIKISVIGAMLIVLQVIAYFVVTNNYNASLRKEYENSLIFNLNSFEDRLTAHYNDTLADIVNIWNKNDNYDYTYRAIINSSRNLSVINDDKSVKSYTLTENNYNNLLRSGINYYKFSELLGEGADDGNQYAIYTKAVNEDTVYVLFYDYDTYFSGNEHFTFGSFGIINKNIKEVFGKYNNPNVYKGNILNADLDGNTNCLFGSVNDTAGMLTVKGLSYSDSYYIVGFIDNASVAAVMKNISGITVTILSVTLLASVIFTVIAVIIFIRNQDYLINFSYDNKKNYVIFVNNYGRITKANAEFKAKFDIENIFEENNLDENFYRLSNKDNIIVKMKDKTKQPCIVNFLSVKKPKGYKLVGVDGADVIDYFKHEIETPYKEPITGLYNFAKFKEDFMRFDNSLKHRRALGIVELSNLKTFGSMFGRAFYNKVFLYFADAINKEFSDIARVYCLDNTEFLIYSDKREDVEALLRDVGQQVDRLNQAVIIDDSVVKIICKFGFVIIDGDTDSDMDMIIASAKASKSRAKSSETNNYYIYHDSQKSHYDKYFEKNYDISKLMEDGDLELFYQPQLSLKDNRISGFEALLRVKKTKELDVKIYDLVRYAEQSGQMIKLGKFIFNTGMSFAQSLKEENIDISLNVSPVQLMQAGFTEQFVAMFEKYDLNPNSISLEITESFLMSDFEQSLSKLQALKKHGIDIHLDDFGEGYSSLLYLKTLPISVIKIDREFIKDIDTNSYSQVIVKAIIGICKQLDIKCIAEGVESEEQKSLLAEYGCDIIQGYLIGKALPPNEVMNIIEKYNKKSVNKEN